MYSKGRQSRYAGPIGIGKSITNIQPPGPRGIVQAVSMEEVYMFAGIDGTGDYWDDDEENKNKYDEAFKTSFVRDFCKQIKGNTSKGKYIRGPGIAGFSTDNKARELYEIIKEQFLSHYENGKYLKIMLAGYSRGSVAVCTVANLLNEDNIPVHGLFLFDPVDRTTTIWGNDTTIPKNVSYVYRTQRKSTTSSRESFGTDCNKFWNGSSVHTTPTPFETTHGGMGGCPWGKKGEANYYNITTSSVREGYTSTSGGYYKKRPLGGVLDASKHALIMEGVLDGLTTLTVKQEEKGYLLAKMDYEENLVNIRGKKACLHKLKKYEDAMAQKMHDKKIREDYNYRRNTGQTWGGFKL